MAIHRKQFLRDTAAAAAGATVGAVARGLVAPDVPDPEAGVALGPTDGWATAASAKGSASPRAPRAVGSVSYAQSGEDLIVAFTMGYLGIGPHITFLDVGANDPV